MTWVIGLWAPGLALMVADVRVSIADPDLRDLEEFGVRKIHTITASMCAGFAGSIEAGFIAVDCLAAEARKAAQHDERPEPETVLMSWVDGLQQTRRADRLDGLARRHGCQLMVVGVSPSANVTTAEGKAMWPRSNIWTVDLGRGVESPSISSATSLMPTAIGSGVEHYLEMLSTYDLNELLGLVRVVGSEPAMLSLLASWPFSSSVQTDPAVGVSPHMFAAAVTREGTHISTNEATPSLLPPGAAAPGQVPSFPPIASTWKETLRLAGLTLPGDSAASLCGAGTTAGRQAPQQHRPPAPHKKRATVSLRHFGSRASQLRSGRQNRRSRMPVMGGWWWAASAQILLSTRWRRAGGRAGRVVPGRRGSSRSSRAARHPSSLDRREFQAQSCAPPHLPGRSASLFLR